MLQIGNQLFQSKTVKESLHPKWNEVYEVRGDTPPPPSDLTVTLFHNLLLWSQALVYEHSGQHLEIELFDEDPDKDDFLGR